MKPLREPMLHFAVAGALLFAADAFLARGADAPDEGEPVRIGEGEVRWLHETFASQWRRPPSPEELSALVANLIEEELLAREARALGLDQHDTIVRRRLAQKLGFLVEDTSRMAEPTDDDLRRFYATNLDLFRIEPRVSLTQVFFSTEKRVDAEADAEAAMTRIAGTEAGDDPAAMGDPSLLEKRFENIDRPALANLFGAAFADAVFDVAPGAWEGPIGSSFGIHLVYVTHVEPAQVRAFESVRATVAQEWRHERETEIKSDYLGRLREKYGVVVESSIRPLLPPDAVGVVQ